jgi:hypothetical protein
VPPGVKSGNEEIEGRLTAKTPREEREEKINRQDAKRRESRDRRVKNFISFYIISSYI